MQNCSYFLRDKNGNLSLRELTIVILLICLLMSWIGDQFLGFEVDATVFLTLAGTLSSCQLGYSVERPSIHGTVPPTHQPWQPGTQPGTLPVPPHGSDLVYTRDWSEVAENGSGRRVGTIPESAHGFTPIPLPPGKHALELLILDPYSGLRGYQYHSEVLSGKVTLPAGAKEALFRNLSGSVLAVNGTEVKKGESYEQVGAPYLLPRFALDGKSFQIVILY
jgi:hypothetical protein